MLVTRYKLGTDGRELARHAQYRQRYRRRGCLMVSPVAVAKAAIAAEILEDALFAETPASWSEVRPIVAASHALAEARLFQLPGRDPQRRHPFEARRGLRA